MENNNSNTTKATTRPPSFDSSSNHSPQSHNPSQPHRHNHAGILVSNTTFMILLIIVSFIVLVIICLILIAVRKLMFFKEKGSSEGSNNSNSIENASNSFIAHSTLSYNSSPDIKGGCLYGGSLVSADHNRSRGVQVFTLKELEMATERFSESNVIGNGGFGRVYRGVLGDGTVAAIKVMRREGKQGERAFRIEVDLLSSLHCPYLVRLLGYCADQNHRLLVFEFMPNGSLQHHLHLSHTQSHALDWGTRLRIALDCARALEFLHEHSVPSVIHRDFKCSNILLDHNFRAKVSDFGLARMGSDKINGQVSTRVLGTTGYLAPEYISTGKLTTKSDVYSYGVVLLELLTGRVPVDTKRPPGEHNLVSLALPRLTNREKLEEMVDPALKGKYSKKELIQVAAIAAVCVQAEADYRPLMMDVVQSLIPLAKNYSKISFSSSSRHQNNGSPKQ